MPDVLAALDDEQRAAAERLHGPLVIHAGAGSGKTRTITHRLAHGVETGAFDAQASLAVTFTGRAAGELRTRLAGLGCGGVQVRTFHSAALRQLRFFYPQVFKKEFPHLIASKAEAVAAAASRCGFSLSREEIRDYASEIEWAKVFMMSPDDYREQSRPVDVAQATAVYSAYLGLNDERNTIDFEDVLLLNLAMVTNYAEVATAVHRQYRHFTVDEFQDVSPVQFELLRAWLGRSTDVCVVGDPAQTIYSFTGASADYLTQFERHFPGAHRVELTNSYRCGPQIVAAANTVMRADPTYVTLTSAASPAASFAVHSYDSDLAEASAIAGRVVERIGQGVRPRDIAILYRINSQSQLLEDQLHAHNIPYAVRGSDRFFERSEVKRATVALRAAAVGPVDKPVSDAVRDVLRNEGWTPAPPSGGASVRGAWESLRVLVDQADDYQREHPDAVLPDFVGWLASRVDMEYEPTANAVTLTTIHAAKGLEWDTVFVAGLSDGLLPLVYAQTPAAHQEERRLLYVAITRAKRSLTLTWAKARNVGGTRRPPSPFLADL